MKSKSKSSPIAWGIRGDLGRKTRFYPLFSVNVDSESFHYIFIFLFFTSSLFICFESVQQRKGLARDIQVYLHHIDITVHLTAEYEN